jgi:hypothetical protein
MRRRLARNPAFGVGLPSGGPPEWEQPEPPECRECGMYMREISEDVFRCPNGLKHDVDAAILMLKSGDPKTALWILEHSDHD